MVTRTYPDAPVIPLETTRVEELVRNALTAAVRDLKGTDVSGGEWLVFHPGEDGTGWGARNMAAPMYRAKAVWDRIASVWRSPETAVLMEYLWSHGAMTKTIHQDGDGVPLRDAWERFVWGDIVHVPLLSLLPRAAAEDLVTHGAYEPWRIDASTLSAAAAEIANTLCNASRTVVAVCPIIGLSIPGGEALEVEPGVRLRPWTPATQCIFLTRHHDQYLGDDMSQWASHSFIEASLCVNDLAEETAGRAIANAIDRVKWVLQVASRTDMPIEEGPAILTSPSGWRGRTLRRGDTLVPNRSLPNISLTADISAIALELSRELRRARPSAPELDGALWLFGRSCNASLPRDVLLDAAVGLEMLLVPGPGEARYRFALHGMALIADEPADAVEADLRKIYTMRNAAAHGEWDETSAAAAIVPRSRMLLAKAVRAVVSLINAGHLDVRATKGDIGQAVEKFVRSKVAAATRGGSPTSR